VRGAYVEDRGVDGGEVGGSPQDRDEVLAGPPGGPVDGLGAGGPLVAATHQRSGPVPVGFTIAVRVEHQDLVADLAADSVFRRVHRRVGAGEGVVGVDERVGGGDTDAGPGLHPVSGDAGRPREGDPDRGRQGRRFGAWREEDELVPTQAREQPTRRHGVGQPVGDHVQELVAGGVAESVVDRPQPVDVREGHDQPGPVEGGRVQGGFGDGPAGQAGDRIAARGLQLAA